MKTHIARTTFHDHDLVAYTLRGAGRQARTQYRRYCHHCTDGAVFVGWASVGPDHIHHISC